jgi:hypothetical protein
MLELVTEAKRQRTCIFCGKLLHPKGQMARSKTNEHVFPAWLQIHLGIASHPVNPTRVRTDTRQIIDVRQHLMDSFKAGAVCHDCNTGWMAQLESEAKPIVLRLIDDPSRLTSLSQGERFILARWTLKTAAVLNRSSSYGNLADKIGRRVPDEHVSILATGQMPSKVVVFGAGYKPIKTLDFLQYALWLAPKNSVPLQTDDRERSYKIALSFRDLVLIVAYYPTPYIFGANDNHYFPIWTGERRVVPINHLIDDSPAKSTSPSLEGLLRNIFVLSNTWLELVENLTTTRFIA